MSLNDFIAELQQLEFQKLAQFQNQIAFLETPKGHKIPLFWIHFSLKTCTSQSVTK